MTEASVISWQSKEAALRDLILLALYRHDGIIIDDTGKVSSKLRGFIGIPESKRTGTCLSTVMQKMELVRLITRRMNDQRTRTYDITLVGTLTMEQIREFEALEEANKSRFRCDTPDTPLEDEAMSDLDRLVQECLKSYGALQHAAKEATRVTSGGTVALNATGVLLAVGIPRARGRRIRYYLRLLGLVVSQSQIPGDDQLWWWTISDKPLNCERLRELATSDKSYEATHANRSGVPQAGPVTVRQVEPTATGRPAVTPAVLNRARATVVMQPVVEEDPLEALAAIAERLDKENGELRERLSSQEFSHQEEVAGLKEQIRALEEQLGTRQQASRRANELIARLGRTATS